MKLTDRIIDKLAPHLPWWFSRSFVAIGLCAIVPALIGFFMPFGLYLIGRGIANRFALTALFALVYIAMVYFVLWQKATPGSPQILQLRTEIRNLVLGLAIMSNGKPRPTLDNQVLVVWRRSRSTWLVAVVSRDTFEYALDQQSTEPFEAQLFGVEKYLGTISCRKNNVILRMGYQGSRVSLKLVGPGPLSTRRRMSYQEWELSTQATDYNEPDELRHLASLLSAAV